MTCEFQPTNETHPGGFPLWRCPGCKTALPSRTGKFAPQECRRQGWGDMVAAAIRTVTFGALTPCGGCKERQEKLNEIGRKLTG